ncbi:hypothetical protein [Bacteroides sp.]|uniref:hypothetical protein n=1 Tax=Bacteroides sp. TaxID=29523 RepID=UPI0026307117|nr:hypothetical protein [Bacteroides sp.]
MDRSRNSIIIFWVGMVCIFFVTGCNNNDNEPNIVTPTQEIHIEVETPQIEGWNTNNNIDTRNVVTNCKTDNTDGLNMEIVTQTESINIPKKKAVTRWSNIDDNTIFRIIAYTCTNATDISTANYKGYGDYKLLTDGTIETITPLVIPAGTYTFVCYSYGDSNAITTFDNSTASITVSHGKNFMTCIKPNIEISNLGSKYTLNDIVFKLRCVHYRVIVTAESGRMANITSCSGTLTLPSNSATFSFTNDEFTRNSTAGTVNLTWSAPNAMSVSSDYIYILPQTSNSIIIKLTPTIGGKVFSNKSITLSSLRFNRGEIYNTKISFTTTEGYIVGGAFWANGNLYKSGNTFAFYPSSGTYSSALSGGAYWPWNQLNPFITGDNTAWNDNNDPCRQVNGGWRTPTSDELINLVNLNSKDSANGRLFNDILLLPKCGYYLEANMTYPEALDANNRGLYRGTGKGTFLDFSPHFQEGVPFINGCNDGYNLSIRCVKN